MTLPIDESANPNWGAFYDQLTIIGPKFLTAVAEGLDEYIELEARGTDSFFSDELEEALCSHWKHDHSGAVWETVKIWTENVREHLLANFGPDSLLPWDQLGIDEDERDDLYASSLDLEPVYKKASSTRVMGKWG